MPLDTAEKARINRSFDFLTDPNELRQRQLVYDRLGLRSFEVAEAEADFRRASRLRSMSAREKQFGTPEIDTVPGGERRTFTEPSGVKRRFEGGVQTSMQLPLLREYSPRDQKRIKQKYEERSAIATDPDMTPEEKQAGLDQVDAFISSIPHISPMMQEPTAQQKYEASIVTDPVTKQRGFFDPKTNKFIPLESSKAQAELEKEKRAAIWKEYNNILSTKGNEEMAPDVAYRRAKNTVALLYGEMPEIKDTIDPQLIPVWRDEVESGWLDVGRINLKNMLKMRTSFIDRVTKDYGESAAQAGHTFMLLWQDAFRNPDDEHNKLVPKFGEQQQRELSQVVTGRMQEGDPRARKETIGGLRVGEGKVTVDGKTVRVFQGRVTVEQPEVPAGLEEIWPTLDEDDKKAIQQKLSEGWTATDILTALGKA